MNDLKPWLLDLWRIPPYEVGRITLRDLAWLTTAVNDRIEQAERSAAHGRG